MTRKGPHPLSADLERFLASLDIPQVSLLVSLRKSWPEIAGPLLSDKCAPARFRNGLLTIAVCNHAWAQELQLGKPLFLSRIVAATGPESPVSDLRFAVGALPAQEKEPAGPGEIPPDADAPEPDRLSEVADPEVRESLRAISRRLRPRG